MAKLPHYPMWVDDFDQDDKVRSMTLAEIGLYLLVLNESWRAGSIPDDAEQLAVDIRRKASDVTAAWPKVRTCYHAVSDGRMVNPRQEIIRADVQRKTEYSIQAGLRSAAKRKGSETTFCERGADGKFTQNRTTVRVTPEQQPEQATERPFGSHRNDRSASTGTPAFGLVCSLPKEEVLREETHTPKRESKSEKPRPIAELLDAPSMSHFRSLAGHSRRAPSFTPNAARFIEEFPGPVNDLAAQYFCQICQTPEIQAALFEKLSVWRASEQWQRGMITGAKKWLAEGDWKIQPKAPAPKQDGKRLEASTQSSLAEQQKAAFNEMSPQDRQRLLDEMAEIEKELGI